MSFRSTAAVLSFFCKDIFFTLRDDVDRAKKRTQGVCKDVVEGPVRMKVVRPEVAALRQKSLLDDLGVVVLRLPDVPQDRVRVRVASDVGVSKSVRVVDDSLSDRR
jgi:hypothetical protein